MTRSMSALAVAALLAGPAAAQPYAWDVSQTSFGNFGVVADGFGQSFTATADSTNVIQVLLFQAPAPTPASIRVELRSGGGLGGPVLGTSDPITIFPNGAPRRRTSSSRPRSR